MSSADEEDKPGNEGSREERDVPSLGDGQTRPTPGPEASVGGAPTFVPGAGPYRRFEVGAVLLGRYVITERLGAGGQAARRR